MLSSGLKTSLITHDYDSGPFSVRRFCRLTHYPTVHDLTSDKLTNRSDAPTHRSTDRPSIDFQIPRRHHPARVLRPDLGEQRCFRRPEEQLMVQDEQSGFRGGRDFTELSG